MKKPHLFPPIKKIKEITQINEEPSLNKKKIFFGKSSEEQSDTDKFRRLEMKMDIGITQILEAINYGNRQILFGIGELSNSINASNEINSKLLNVIIERTSSMDKSFRAMVQSYSNMKKIFSQNSNEMLGKVPLKTESSKVKANDKNSSSSNTAKSQPNFINNEINSNDNLSRKITIYKRKKLSKNVNERKEQKDRSLP